MNLEIYGSVAAPAIAVVGTWDPVTDTGFRLLADLRDSARRMGLASVPVLLDPPPAQLVNGARRWPSYHDGSTRLHLLRHAGVDGVAVVRFAESDLFGTAADLFETLCSRMTIGEFWLKTGQAFGRGPRGSGRAVAIQAAKRGIRLKVLTPEESATGAAKARTLLRCGCVRGAWELIGQPPMRRRPAAGEPIRLGWPAGRYRFVPLDVPERPSMEAVGDPIDTYEDPTGGAMMDWPAATEWLALIAGPGDFCGSTSVAGPSLPHPQANSPP